MPFYEDFTHTHLLPLPVQRDVPLPLNIVAVGFCPLANPISMSLSRQEDTG